MELCQEFNDLLHTLKFCDRNKQCCILKKMLSTIQYCTKEDLQGMLDFINTTYDMELQVKLFSILSIHLINNDTTIELFVTFNPIYDAIDRIISKNLPRKTTVVLNFLTLLLQSDCTDNHTSRKSSLYMYTQNQIRLSGCLASMADIFTSGMTYQDTWRALCKCLAESCKDSERNQNYCTHLIPKCVRKCNHRNMETFPLLQSLIYNNKRNAQLFLECNGMSLFKRELLQYESVLQFLSLVIQTSSEATVFAQNMTILQYVHDLLRLCGPYTPTGQWATVILYHADIKLKAYGKKQKENVQNKINKSNRAAAQNSQINGHINDTMLFKNVIKEIVQWHTNEKDICNNLFVTNKSNNKRHQQESMNSNIGVEQLCSRPSIYSSLTERKIVYSPRNKPIDELSLSFLGKQFNDNDKYVLTDRYKVPVKNNVTRSIKRTYNNDYSQIHFTKSSNIIKQTSGPLDASIFYKENNNNTSDLDLNEFKPNFVSTPKQRKYNTDNKNKKFINIASMNSKKYNGIKNVSRVVPKKKLVNKSLKQRSFKTRIFNAINNSCTALVSSVTSIFKNKNVDPPTKDSSSKSRDDNIETCSYSFTEYMRKRDAVVFNDRTDHQKVGQNFSLDPDSCRSCNNTNDLKNKMLTDYFLKESVKKLKIGVNMYGCDFKKISKTLWPHDNYMTPAVLYKLYRKLIIK